MNYEILIGRTVAINDTPILVEKIEKIKTTQFIVKYRINGGPVFDKIDIGTMVSIVEAEIEEKSRPKGILAKFGLFWRIFVLDNKTITHTEQSKLFSFSLGLRKYGYKNVGIFLHFRLGLKCFETEFCFNEKKEYVSGRLPESINEYQRVF